MVEERRKVLGQARQDRKLELTTEELDYGFLWETSNMFAADDRVSCVVQEDVVGDADPGIPSTSDDLPQIVLVFSALPCPFSS